MTRYIAWLTFVLVSFGVLFFFCSRQSPAPPEEVILAKIGDRTISRQEFISRAEYAIRPPYCKGDHYVHRKIVLNSLIAEKLLALEAGDNNPLTNNEQFQLYLQGRKEQSMRQWLYYNDFYAKAEVDSNELEVQVALSGRTCRVAYFTLPDSQAARAVGEELLSSGASFAEIYRRIGGLDAPAQREISWSSPEHEAIIRALFNKSMAKDRLIGPVKADDKYVFMQILGWTDRLAVTETEKQKRYQDARQRIVLARAGTAFEEYLRRLMKGKTLRFSPETFPRIVQTMGDYLLTSPEDKDQLLSRQVWQEDESDPSTAAKGSAALDDIADAPFLTDGELDWSVRDFQRALLTHPLVFRKKKMKKSEFAAELQKAIADMIQDHYVTRDAYGKRYDRINLVERNTGMWHDHLLSFYQRNRFLSQNRVPISTTKDFLPILRQHLDPYVVSLFKKYSGQIQIDTGEFEKLRLTDIDMTVIQKNVPFPIAVPSFPILTTHSLLDYGKKMAKD